MTQLLTKGIRIAPFRFDVTPPLGHSLCGGWIMPVIGYDDPLEAIGYVLQGAGEPIVVCVVDWLGISNEANVAWRRALAEGAGTSPERVAVHTVHQHNAPLVCFEAARIAGTQPDLPAIFDMDFVRSCLEAGQRAVKAAVVRARPVTHVGHGEARVKKVASNRRVARDEKGNVTAMRRTRCTDPELVALPEGLIDPMLKTVAFYDGPAKLASCHYYATHPMSYYEDGRVSSDFCGLARKRRQKEEPECTHIYFTGCGANIGAGKYNDGSPEARKVLTQRMYEGIVASEANMSRRPLGSARWRTQEILLEPNPSLDADALMRRLTTRSAERTGPFDFGDAHQRLGGALKLAWMNRCRRQEPIILSALELEDISILHLPAEVFVEYQLRAQQIRRDRFVAIAAYGDDGPFYIPTREEYPTGGYEAGVALASDAVDGILTEGIRKLLEAAP